MRINLSKIIFLNILFLNIGFIFSTTEEFDIEKNAKERLKNILNFFNQKNKELNKDLKNDILNQLNENFYQKTENILSNLSIYIKKNKFNKKLDNRKLSELLRDLNNFNEDNADININGMPNYIKAEFKINLRKKALFIRHMRSYIFLLSSIRENKKCTSCLALKLYPYFCMENESFIDYCQYCENEFLTACSDCSGR